VHMRLIKCGQLRPKGGFPAFSPTPQSPGKLYSSRLSLWSPRDACPPLRPASDAFCLSFAKLPGLFSLPCDCPPFEAISSCLVRLLIAIHDVHVPTVVLFWSCTTCTNCTSEGLGYLSRDRRAMPCRPWMLSFSVSRHPLLRSLVCSRCELISKLLPYACMFHLDAELFYVALATNIDHGLPPLIQERQ
jgi:hypothetical protein